MNIFRSMPILLIGLAIGVALFAVPYLYAETPTENQTHAKLWGEISAELNGVEDDTDQFVLLAGGTEAQLLNAQIPLVFGQTFELPRYTPIKKGSAQYATALRCLTEAVYYEAGNETRAGKEAVAQVVLNRMRHRAFPNSVCGVVYQGVNDRVCQFSFTCDGSLLDTPVPEVWDSAEAVARDVLAGKQVPEIGTATHYHADYVVPKWAYTLGKLKVIGTHIFYRMPGSIGDPGAFSAKWAGIESVPTINWASQTEGMEPRMENAVLEEEELPEVKPEDLWTPGLTVAPDKTDRHAATDVGGRIDTTKEWRLSIPDPVNHKGSFDAAVKSQMNGSAAQ